MGCLYTAQGRLVCAEGFENTNSIPNEYRVPFFTDYFRAIPAFKDYTILNKEDPMVKKNMGLSTLDAYMYNPETKEMVLLPYGTSYLEADKEKVWTEAKLVMPVNGRVKFENYNRASNKMHVCMFGNTTSKESTFNITDLVSAGLEVTNSKAEDTPVGDTETYKTDKKVYGPPNEKKPNILYTSDLVRCLDFVETKR